MSSVKIALGHPHPNPLPEGEGAECARLNAPASRLTRITPSPWGEGWGEGTTARTETQA
ncbi:hypothetical protein D3C78_1741200 [compost metagenome]